jgi:glycosyltransferase involved in cell wall biosynthesis
MSFPIVSVVVPVYNVEQYLAQCLESLVPAETGAMEIIVVNDGSTDGSATILARYQQKYPDVIRVVTQSNAGLSAARNTGLREANGRFVMFVDSDDYLGKGTVEDVVACAVEHNCDMVEFEIVSFGDGEEPVFRMKSKVPRDEVLSGSAIVAWMQHINASACNKLFDRSIFASSGITFPVGVLHEDMATTPLLIATAKRYMRTGAGTYFYRYRRTGSITTGTTGQRAFDGLVEGTRRLCLEAARLGLLRPDTVTGWGNYIVKSYLHCMLKWVRNHRLNVSKAISIYGEFTRDIAKAGRPAMSVHHRALFTLLSKRVTFGIMAATYVWANVLFIKYQLEKRE